MKQQQQNIEINKTLPKHYFKRILFKTKNKTG